jgi:hypothetical protein
MADSSWLLPENGDFFSSPSRFAICYLPSAIRYWPADAYFSPVSSLMRFPIHLLMCAQAF